MAPVPTLSTTQHPLPGAGEGAYTLCAFPTASSAAASGSSAADQSQSQSNQQQQQQQQQVALFGGEDGILYVLPSSSSSTEPKAVRTFDEGIRSLAVSADGRRVVVGLESGETRIFAYESPYGSDGDQLHAFLNPTSASSSLANAAADDDDGMGGLDDNGDDDDDDDGFGGMMSQEDDLAFPSKSSTDSSTGMTEYAGPRFDAPVRDLAFLLPPSSGGGGGGGSSSKYYLAIATESPASFCVVDVSTADSAAGGERYLQTEAESSHDSGGVRGLAVGKGTVATLGLDGRLCVWKVAGSDPALDWEELHQDAHKAVPKADIGAFNGSDVADQVTHPAIQADGSWLAIPGRSDIQLRHSTERYKKERFLCSKASAAADSEGDDNIRGHSDVTVCLAFSPDGNYLLSSGRDGRVVVWKIAKAAPSADSQKVGDDDDATCGEFVCELPRTSIAASIEATSSTVVTSMIWSTSGAVRIARSDGSVTVVSDIDGFIQSTKKTAQGASTSKDATVEAAAADGNKSRVAKKSDSVEADSDDDVDFGDDAAASSKANDDDGKAKSSKNSNRFVDDEADEDDDDGEDITKDDDANSATEKDQPPADEVGGAGGLDDFVVDDDAADGFPMDDDDDDDGRDGGGNLQPLSGRRGAAYDAPEMQPAFAPSSTPLSASTTRILCWNHIGTLTIRDDGPNNTVDINFVDGAFRRPVSFTDNLNFIVGSLGEDGGIFASDVDDDEFDGADDMDDMVDGLNMSDATKRILKRSNRRKKKGGSEDAPKGSSIYFHRFETFGPIKDKDWVLTLPDGEMALGCACGEGWAAVATSRRFLRLYSSGGNQGPVTWLKGDLITMVGRGRFLAVFYHENTPMPDGTQRIGYQLLDAASGNLVSTGSVSAISPGSTMTWAGFSNDYSLMVMDSDGMLSMLASETGINTVGGGWEWSPMLDTVGLRKSNDDSFWPVTCMDGKLVCVPLKGGNEHPDAVRRPVTTALGFRLPLARGALGKFSALEDLQVRADLSLKQKKFVNYSIAPDDEELMNEYDAMCAQVDKVTLKLFFDILKAGKVERALDLVERLHLEKSFEIAVKASDRLNFLKLSDRIEAARDARFPPEQFDEEEEEMEDGVDRRYFAQRPLNTDRYEDDRDVDEESVQSSTAITPDVNRRGGVKRNREEFHSDIEEEEEVEEEPEQRPAPSKRKINPFAKKKMESPGKGQLTSPLRSPSAKPKLSRNSTFSAQSRAKTKGQKRIL